jgi:hypothetical protein
VKSETLAYVAFAILFLVCTAGVLGFVLIAWLGMTLGVLWMAAAASFVVVMLFLLYGYSGLGAAGPPPASGAPAAAYHPLMEEQQRDEPDSADGPSNRPANNRDHGEAGRG